MKQDDPVIQNQDNSNAAPKWTPGPWEVEGATGCFYADEEAKQGVVLHG